MRNRSSEQTNGGFQIVHSGRNNAWMDWWSLTHFLWGVLLGWIMAPFWALMLLIAWEPLEIFVLSPLARNKLGKEFGYETLRNSLSDILFDAAGVATGAFILTTLAAPPFHFFG